MMAFSFILSLLFHFLLWLQGDQGHTIKPGARSPREIIELSSEGTISWLNSHPNTHAFGILWSILWIISVVYFPEAGQIIACKSYGCSKLVSELSKWLSLKYVCVFKPNFCYDFCDFSLGSESNKKNKCFL